MTSAAVGMCIGTSLCCFWFASVQESKDVFLGVGSAAILVAGIFTSHVSKSYQEALMTVDKINLYSAIPKTDSRASLSTIAEETEEV